MPSFVKRQNPYGYLKPRADAGSVRLLLTEPKQRQPNFGCDAWQFFI